MPDDCFKRWETLKHTHFIEDHYKNSLLIEVHSTFHVYSDMMPIISSTSQAQAYRKINQNKGERVF